MKLSGNHFNEAGNNGNCVRFIGNKVSPGSSTIVIHNGNHEFCIAEASMSTVRTPKIHMYEFKRRSSMNGAKGKM